MSSEQQSYCLRVKTVPERVGAGLSRQQRGEQFAGLGDLGPCRWV